MATISPDELRAIVVAAVGPLPPCRLPLVEAGSLVLAEPVIAEVDLPRWTNAAMDGYAVRSKDTAAAPVKLRVVGSAFAGRPPERDVRAGEALLVTTGAVIPSGADAVVPLEEVRLEEGEVSVDRPVLPGRHVRRAGEDASAGEVVLPGGSILGPGQLAAAGAAGLLAVSVYPRPRVAVVPTGDEVRAAGEALDDGQVHDAASVALAWLIADVGAVPVPRPIAPDDPRALEVALCEAAAAADAVVTVGGVSVGERDLVRRVRSGGEVRGYRAALRPGGPFAFGRVHGVPLFGLPGNPGSALVSFEEFVRPALQRMLGKPPRVRPTVRARLAEAASGRAGRTTALAVEVIGRGSGLIARPAGGGLRGLASGTGWAILPPGAGDLPAGSEVEVRLLLEPS